MAKGDGKSSRGKEVGLFSTDFNVNIDWGQALKGAQQYDQLLDRITKKVEKLGQMSPLSSRGGAAVNPAMLNPGFSGQVKGVYRDASGRNVSMEDAVQPQYRNNLANPMPMVFSNNALQGGQTNRRRDPTPFVADSTHIDPDGTARPVAREQPRRTRNPQQQLREVAAEYGPQLPAQPYYTPAAPLSRRQQVLADRAAAGYTFRGIRTQADADRTPTIIGPQFNDPRTRPQLTGAVLDETPKMRTPPPLGQPTTYPTATMTRRQRDAFYGGFGRTNLYEGRQVSTAQSRMTEQGYTIIPPQFNDPRNRPQLVDPNFREADPWLRPNIEPGARDYPTARMTANQRGYHRLTYGRESPFPGGPQRASQRGYDASYTQTPGEYNGMRALPSMDDVAGRGQRPATDYGPGMPYVQGESQRVPYRPGVRVGVPTSEVYEQYQRGLNTIGRGVQTGRRVFSPQNMLSAASNLFVLQAAGQTIGRAGSLTVGQSMKIDEYQALLANSMIGQAPDGSQLLNRDSADRLSKQLINTEFFAGQDLTTTELGLSRAALAESYKGLAPIVRVGAKGPQDFAQRMQRGALLSSLLMARDPSQGQAGVNVALSELLAGGSTRFLSLSRRFELSNSQLRNIEKEMGGEGVADPVAVAMKALEQMGLGTDYLKTRAGTFRGEIAQSGAIFANARADLFDRSTDILGGQLGRVNDAFATYQNTEAYQRQLAGAGTFAGRLFRGATQPWVQTIAGNMLRSGGGLDEGYLTRGISEMVTTGINQRTGLTGFTTEDEKGRQQFVTAAEAFREAAQTIQAAHLERLLEAPAYSVRGQTGNDSLIGAGVTIGSTLLLNRIFGGAGGVLLKSLIGGSAAQTGGARAVLAAAGAAAAPAATILAGAAGIGATYASVRRQGRTADMYRTIKEENPNLLEGISPLGRASLEETQGPAWERLLPSNLFGPLAEGTFNLVSGGRFGERVYNERGATRDTVVAGMAQRGQIENAISGMGVGIWKPGMSREQYQGAMRERVATLQAQAKQNPDTPIGQWFQKTGSFDIAVGAADSSWETVAQDSNRLQLETAIQKAFNYSRGFSIRDPETGKIEKLKPGFSQEEGLAFAARMTTDDAAIPGGINQDKFTNVINAASLRVERQLAGIKEGQDEQTSVYRQLNLRMLPGVFSDYNPNADMREVMPSGYTNADLGTPNGLLQTRQQNGRGNKGFTQLPLINETTAAPKGAQTLDKGNDGQDSALAERRRKQRSREQAADLAATSPSAMRTMARINMARAEANGNSIDFSEAVSRIFKGTATDNPYTAPITATGVGDIGLSSPGANKGKAEQFMIFPGEPRNIMPNVTSSVRRQGEFQPLPLLEPTGKGNHGKRGGRLAFRRTSAEATGKLLGGQATADHQSHLDRHTAGGGGFDVLANDGQFYAPTSGDFDYLRTAEDYDQPMYQQMFPGGRRTYGVSAVITDPFGKTFSVSHLTDNPQFKDGKVHRGEWIGSQGNTGQTASSRFPGRTIRDGYLEDTGEFAAGAGSHGHVQFGQFNKGKWQELDAQLAPSYWQAGSQQQAQMGAPSISPKVEVNINANDSKAQKKQEIDTSIENLRSQLYTLLLDGTLGELMDLDIDLKSLQGQHKDPARPKARGNT